MLQVLALKEEEEMRRRHWELPTQSTISTCINDTGNKGPPQSSLLSDGTAGGGIRCRSSYGIDGRKHDLLQTSSSVDPPRPCSHLADDSDNLWAAGVGDDVMVSPTELPPSCVVVDRLENVANAHYTNNDPLIVDITLQGRRAEEVRHHQQSEEGKEPERTAEGVQDRKKGVVRDPVHREASRAVSRETKHEIGVDLSSHGDDCSDDGGCGIALSGTQQRRQRCSFLHSDGVEQQDPLCGSDSTVQVPYMKTELSRSNSSTSSSANARSETASNRGVAKGRKGRNANGNANFSDESWSSSEDEADVKHDIVGTPTSRVGAGGGNAGGKGCALNDDWAGSEAYGSDDDCAAYDEHERASVRLKAAQAVTGTRNSNSGVGESRAVARQPFGAGATKIDVASDVRYCASDAHSVAGHKKMGGELGVVAASKSSGKTNINGSAMRSSTTVIKGSDGSKLRKIQEARHLAQNAGHCAGQFRPELPLDNSSLPPQRIARRSAAKPLCYYNKYNKGRAIVTGGRLRNRLREDDSAAATAGVPPSCAKDDLRNHNRRRRWVSRERNHADDDCIGNPLRVSCTDPERQHRRGVTGDDGGGCVSGGDSHSHEDDDARLTVNDGTAKTRGTSSDNACKSLSIKRDEGAFGHTWVEREFLARVEAARQEALKETAATAAAPSVEQEHSPRSVPTYLPGIISRGCRSAERVESGESTVKR